MQLQNCCSVWNCCNATHFTQPLGRPAASAMDVMSRSDSKRECVEICKKCLDIISKLVIITSSFFKGLITQSKSTKPQAEFNINSNKVLVFRKGQIFKKPILFWSQSSHYFHSALASFLLIYLFLLFIYTFICFSWKNRNHLALTIRNIRECILLMKKSYLSTQCCNFR